MTDVPNIHICRIRACTSRLCGRLASIKTARIELPLYVGLAQARPNHHRGTSVILIAHRCIRLPVEILNNTICVYHDRIYYASPYTFTSRYVLEYSLRNDSCTAAKRATELRTSPRVYVT